LGYNFDIRRLSNKLAIERQSWRNLSNERLEKQREIKRLQVHNAQFSKEKNSYQDDLKILPATINGSQLLSQISSLSRQNRMVIKTIKLLPVKKRNGLKVLPVDMEITGNFFQFQHFLSGLSHLSFLVLIGNFSLQSLAKMAEANELIFDLIVEIYFNKS
jgi:Tfp pilus assembly protein PilO